MSNTSAVVLAMLMASAVGEGASDARRVAVLRNPYYRGDEAARLGPFTAKLRGWDCEPEIIEPRVVLDEARTARYAYIVAYAVPTFAAAQYRSLDAYARKGGIFVMAGHACTLLDKAPRDDIGYWDSIGALCRPVIMRMPLRWDFVQVVRGGKRREVASVKFRPAGPLTEGIPVNRDIPLKGLAVPWLKVVWDAEIVAEAKFAKRGHASLLVFTRVGRGASVSVACLLTAQQHIQKLYANIFSAQASQWLTRVEEKPKAVAPVGDTTKLHPKFITKDDLATHAAEMKVPQLKTEWDREYRAGVAILAAQGDITPTEHKGRFFYSWQYVAHHDPDGKRWSKQARQAVFRNFVRAALLGRLYQITGEKRFGLAGKRFLLRTLREFPRLAPLYYFHSGANTDLGTGESARSAGIAYDCVFDLMSDDERRFARQAMMEKLVIPTYVDYVLNDAGEETSNWIGVVCGGVCTLCLAIKEEAAAEYPDFSRYYDGLKAKLRRFFDASIGIDGGCYEGVGYQNYGLGKPTDFVELQKKVTGDDWCKKLRLNETWYFALYTLFPDGRGHVGFGDAAVNGQYSPSLIRRLAKVYNNGYLQWLYDRENDRNPFFPRDYRQTGVKPISPDDAGLPTSRLFRSIGWAIFRTGWSDDDVMLAFKSEPFMGFSHSHADENSFTLWAYGERLAIDGLSLKHYDDPRLAEYKMGPAHNTILVNGEGQKRPRYDVAPGKIVSYLGTDFYDQVAGDAAATYGDVLHTFVRDIVFVKPKYFVIFDDLRAAKGPAKFEWPLHAVGGKETFDVAGNVVTIRRPKAKLAVKVVEPRDFRYEIAEFGETPDWQDGKWREAKRSCIKIRPARPSVTARFLTVLYPLRPNESIPQIEGLPGAEAGLYGVKVAAGQGSDTLLFAPSGKGIAVEGLRTDGTKCMVRRGDKGELLRFAVHDATFLDVNGQRAVSSDKKATAAALIEPSRMTAVLTMEPDARVSLRVRSSPRSVALDGAAIESGRFEYRPSTRQLAIPVPKGTHTLVAEW